MFEIFLTSAPPITTTLCLMSVHKFVTCMLTQHVLWTHHDFLQDNKKHSSIKKYWIMLTIHWFTGQNSRAELETITYEMLELCLPCDPRLRFDMSSGSSSRPSCYRSTQRSREIAKHVETVKVLWVTSWLLGFHAATYGRPHIFCTQEGCSRQLYKVDFIYGLFCIILNIMNIILKMFFTLFSKNHPAMAFDKLIVVGMLYFMRISTKMFLK